MKMRGSRDKLESIASPLADPACPAAETKLLAAALVVDVVAARASSVACTVMGYFWKGGTVL